MKSAVILALVAASQARPQRAGGGGGGGGITMLRFGCAQVVIDRIDPCVPNQLTQNTRWS